LGVHGLFVPQVRDRSTGNEVSVVYACSVPHDRPYGEHWGGVPAPPFSNPI